MELCSPLSSVVSFSQEWGNMSQSPMVPKGAGQTEGLSAMFSLFFFATLWNWDFDVSNSNIAPFWYCWTLSMCLGRWIRKWDSSEKGERGQNGSRKSYKELNFKHLTIREFDKLDIGSRRSLSFLSYTDWSVCFRLSQALAFIKTWVVWPSSILPAWPSAALRAVLFNFHEDSQSQHPARLRSCLWTSQGLAL